MGLVGALTIVPKAAFKQHKGDLAELPTSRDWASFWIDKGWMHLHTALREMRKPLCLAVEGDLPCYGRLEGGLIRAQGEEAPDDEEDEEEDEEGYDFYMGYASPTFVKKVDRALGSLRAEALLAAIKAFGWPSTKGDQKYYLIQFGNLKEAYHAAAAQGDALMIMIT